MTGDGLKVNVLIFVPLIAAVRSTCDPSADRGAADQSLVNTFLAAGIASGQQGTRRAEPHHVEHHQLSHKL